jgi:hypothetical protein
MCTPPKEVTRRREREREKERERKKERGNERENNKMWLAPKSMDFISNEWD